MPTAPMTSAATHRDHGASTGARASEELAMNSVDGAESASSISARASAMSRSRRRTSF
jgi:hypothetical protein